MSKIWYCRNCGYEVDARGRCHRCRQKLIASPLPPLAAGDEDTEVGYRIADWEDRARGRLIEALIEGGIAHRFEDDDLVVGTDDEERVDALVDELAEWSGDALMDDEAVDLEPGDVDGEVVRSVGMLYEAARRLRVDPTDMEADGDVAEASAGVFMTEDYPGAGPDTWAAVGRVTRRLLAALGAEEALEDEIRQQAGVLATLLAPLATTVQTATGQEVASAPVNGTGETGARVEGAEETPAPVEAAPSGEAHPPAAGVPDWAPAGEAPASSDAAGARSDADADADGTSGIDDDAAAERLLGGGPETSYEVPEWLPEQRALLGVLLEDQAIPHAWDGLDLVVASVDEDAVEALFDRIGGVDVDEDDETRYRALEELFAAVDRLANAPDDEERAADVVGASGAVEGSTPLGYDDGKWLALRRRTRTLADSIEHNAQTDVVAAQAVSLRDALRELV